MVETKSSKLTTLILGAGLGKEYGFPDGPGLKKLIIDELDDHEQELREILSWWGAETVDELATDYPKHANRMREIVTKILYRLESPASLQQGEKSNTYALMLRQISKAQAKGDQVRIITFNYDRSLQYLLQQTNSFLPPSAKIDRTIITPIYGRIALLGFEDTANQYRPMGHHGYGSPPIGPIFSIPSHDPFEERARLIEEQEQREAELQAERDLLRCSTIEFIGELKGKSKPEIAAMLESSDQIFFLGVGYHTANMALLGFDFTKRHPKKIIAGTGFNLTNDDIAAIKESYPAIIRIESCDAYTFLRRKFDISEADTNLSKRELSILEVL